MTTINTDILEKTLQSVGDAIILDSLDPKAEIFSVAGKKIHFKHRGSDLQIEMWERNEKDEKDREFCCSVEITNIKNILDTSFKMEATKIERNGVIHRFIKERSQIKHKPHAIMGYMMIRMLDALTNYVKLGYSPESERQKKDEIEINQKSYGMEVKRHKIDFYREHGTDKEYAIKTELSLEWYGSTYSCHLSITEDDPKNKQEVECWIEIRLSDGYDQIPTITKLLDKLKKQNQKKLNKIYEKAQMG